MFILRKLLVRFSMRKKRIRPTRVIVITFAAIILLGAVLLSLPAASRTGEATPPLDALFTATSATCVTGLIVRDTYTHWSLFGHIVILCLIQIGGLGFMSFVSVFFFVVRRRIGLRERLLIMQSMSLNEVEGVVALIRRVLLGTLLFEGAGAIILSACFIPDFGWGGGIWRGIFHSVSAFCNAGFDLLGSAGPYSSLISYADHPVVLLTIAALIVIGGIGFLVWSDIQTKRSPKKFSMYTKLVLLITGTLLLLGWVLFLVFEWNNPATLGNMPVWQKLINGLFQSVTTRTAGFDAIGQGAMTDNGKLFSCVLMFIGGSSGSTAGGVKTVTIGILILAAIATLRGQREVVIFKRRLDDSSIRNAMTLVMTCLILTLVGAIWIGQVEGVSFINSIYEVVSAYGTVGLTTGITPSLGTVSRLILILFMFFGRVGVMTISVAFMVKGRAVGDIRYPIDSVIIG